MRRALLLVSLLFVAPQRARADELSPAARARCIESVVRVEVDTRRGTISGSGTVIDPRGYILTNFHVVGNTGSEVGLPGVHHDKRLRIAIVRNQRDLVRDEYVAEVVRGNVQLDLALLHIVGRADESRLETSPFVAMPVRRDLPALGAEVWALGFPAGVRTINITAGQIAGFENNSAGDPAWMRTDTEFNPGNSGGALIDRECRLVGVPTAVSRAVEPIELARPAARIPDAWLTALTSGEVLRSEPTEGVREIAILTAITDSAFGDCYGRQGDVRYYRVPAPRPGVVSISPRLASGVVRAGGYPAFRPGGQVVITASDGPETQIAVFVPRGSDGRAPTLQLRYTPMSAADAARIASASGGSEVHGRVSRAEASGDATYVALAPPSLDAEAVIAGVRNGTVSETALRRELVALSAIGTDGAFVLRTPPGTYTLLLFGASGVENAGRVVVNGEGLDAGEVGAGGGTAAMARSSAEPH